MKNSRFNDSQIIAVLKQAEDGTPVPELCREHAISYAGELALGGIDTSIVAPGVFGMGPSTSSIAIALKMRASRLPAPRGQRPIFRTGREKDMLPWSQKMPICRQSPER